MTGVRVSAPREKKARSDRRDLSPEEVEHEYQNDRVDKKKKIFWNNVATLQAPFQKRGGSVINLGRSVATVMSSWRRSRSRTFSVLHYMTRHVATSIQYGCGSEKYVYAYIRISYVALKRLV